MESVSNGLSHNQARCRLAAWQDIENARKKACSPGVALGLLHAVDLFEARLSRSRRHLPRRGSFTRRPMPRTSMATRGRRSRTRLASRCGISTRRAWHLDAASQGVGIVASPRVSRVLLYYFHIYFIRSLVFPLFGALIVCIWLMLLFTCCCPGFTFLLFTLPFSFHLLRLLQHSICILFSHPSYHYR